MARGWQHIGTINAGCINRGHVAGFEPPVGRELHRRRLRILVHAQGRKWISAMLSKRLAPPEPRTVKKSSNCAVRTL